MSQEGRFALDLTALVEQTKAALDASVREIVLEVGQSLIRMSPVGNPELWAANVQYRSRNRQEADDYDFKVAMRNTAINLTESNFTRTGKLKKGVKYAKPLTRAEREQNFDINGRVSGKGYIGGRFRANWQFALQAPAEGVIDEVDPTGTHTLAALQQQLQGMSAGQMAYIVNNLPYAVPLEHGHSTQAPHGMVRITVARFQEIVNAAISRHQV